MKLSNVHTHTLFCDGMDTVAHMADRAFEMGFVSLGFSGHCFQTNNGFGIKDERAYAQEVAQAAQKYAGRMKIWLGMEMDYYSRTELKCDYTLGAVHHAQGPDGRDYPVDHSFEDFERLFNTGFGRDAASMARSYYQRVIDMCDRLKPDVIAHYDLVRKFNEKGHFFDEADAAYRKYALEGLDAVCDGKRLLEINTGAIARDWRSDPYPTLELLARWRELGGRVILGSDCHNAERLRCGFDLALDMARAAGYDEIWRLGEGEELFVADKI